MASEKVRRVQELRRSAAASPRPSRKVYVRKPKHRTKENQS